MYSFQDLAIICGFPDATAHKWKRRDVLTDEESYSEQQLFGAYVGRHLAGKGIPLATIEPIVKAIAGLANGGDRYLIYDTLGRQVLFANEDEAIRRATGAGAVQFFVIDLDIFRQRFRRRLAAFNQMREDAPCLTNS